MSKKDTKYAMHSVMLLLSLVLTVATAQSEKPHNSVLKHAIRQVSPWKEVAIGTPKLSDELGWSQHKYYSTIQTAIVKSKVYLVARGAGGMNTYRLNGKEWETVAFASPKLSDANGWGQEKYYSTIQTAVVKGKLFMVARGAAGIYTYRLNGDAWESIGSPSLFSDNLGWGQPKYFSTIQTAVVRGKLYIVARGAAGIFTYRLRGQAWKEVDTGSPGLSDGLGWGAERYYSTIQTVVVKKKLYLVARGAAGIHTYRLNGNAWERLTNGSPALSDGLGWGQKKYYSTIQTAVVNGNLFLVARGAAGIFTYKWSDDKWESVFIGAPALSDALGWGREEFYSTIQVAGYRGKMHLVARGIAGIFTYRLDSNVWETISSGSPQLSDSFGWSRERYYSTIQTAVVKRRAYLVARGAAGIFTYFAR